MLPITHGVAFTRRAVLYYTIALTLVTLLPLLMRMSGVLYLSAAAILDADFLRRALYLTRSPSGGRGHACGKTHRRSTRPTSFPGFRVAIGSVDQEATAVDTFV